MSYVRVNWQDHVVERPRTFTEAANGDGSKTLTPAPGKVLQQGTPQSATNFNAMDEALQHFAIAFDVMETIHQAEMRAARKDIAALQEQVKALAGK